MVITHGVQVIQDVRRTPVHLPRRPLSCGTFASLAPLDHMGRHVHPIEREPDQSRQFIPPSAHLPEPLQVDNKDVRDGP